MNPDSLQGFFRAGVLVALVSFVLALYVPRDSAEFVISVCSLGIGLTLIALIAVAIKLGQR